MSRSTNPFSTGLKLEDMKKLSNAPRMIKDWSNDEIILFLRGWNEFSFEQIHSMIPDRWVLYSSMWATQKKLKEEAERRNLRITKDPLRRPMSEWTDKDLQGYLNVMNNHRFDSDFQLKYTGFESMNDCNQLTYKVKKELQSRKLLA